jgi:hypothetical protein
MGDELRPRTEAEPTPELTGLQEEDFFGTLKRLRREEKEKPC